MVVYCQRSERIHCLDRPASVVWALRDGTRDLDGVEEVAAMIGGDPGRLRRDVAAVVGQFQALGILR